MRVGLLLWLAGLPGIVVAVTWMIPALVAHSEKPPPVVMPLVVLAGGVQSAALLGLAVWAGVVLAGPVDLHAPVVEALAGGRSILSAARPLVLPGLAGGAAGGLLLVLLDRVRPAALARLEDLSPPLPVRLLYGGVTEELLIRWGVMSVLLWAFWVVFQGRDGAPEDVWVWTAIAVSAVVFGLAHLPTAAALVGGLTRPVVAYVVAGNALFGLVAGYLYWRSGLEAAILAHASAHVLSYAVERF